MDSIYSPIEAKIEKSIEKDLNVRISCRTKAQLIPEGLEHKMALTAKIKKKYEKFVYDPLYYRLLNTYSIYKTSNDTRCFRPSNFSLDARWTNFGPEKVLLILKIN